MSPRPNGNRPLPPRRRRPDPVQVAIVDYGMGNLDSVSRAVEECGGRPIVTSDLRELESAAAVILPGVGSFGKGMANIRDRGLDRVLIENVAKQNVPILGLCLGMQLLVTTGVEGETTAGLGLISGRVERLEATSTLRVPHVGWNEVHAIHPHPLFDGIPSGRDFYFVHSYHVACDNSADVVATTPYGEDITVAFGRGAVAGVQFHPEKSQRVGFQLLRNFLAWSGRS
jgi:imidazole glycerol-phosphate synthase subunit HisH